MRRALFTLTLVWGLALPSALAQPLATLAPVDTFAVLGWQSTDAPNRVWQALGNDLEALGWERAGNTLEKLGAASGDADLREFLGMFGKGFHGGPRSGGTMGSSRFERCLENQLADFEALKDAPHAALESALLTVSLTSYNPLPAVTAVARVAPEYEAAFTDLQRAIIRCSARSGSEVKRLNQGGAPIVVIGNAGDFPIVVSRVGRLFIAGSNPEAVRGVLRRVKGSREGSLAQTPLFIDNRELLTRPGVNFAFSAATLSDLTESLSANFADAQTQPLVDRLVAALRTLGTYAGTLGIVEDELTLESQLNVNPEGGDPELAALLLESMPAPEPRFAPNNSYGVSTANVSLQQLFDYLDGWAELAGEVRGERLTLRQLAQDELGLNLDTALLGWLGDAWENVSLEPYATDLAPYIYGAPQVLALETTDEAAARAGIDELGRAFRRLLDDPSFRQEFEGSDSDIFFQSATETQVFGGIDITRTRFGPNLDIGTAFLDDTLLIGMPASALESAISTAQGYTRPIGSDEAFSALQAALPPNTTQFGYRDASSQLQGLSDLTRLVSQPLAFVALAGVSELEGTQSPDNSLPSFADLLHVTDLLPESLEVIAEHTGALSSYSSVEGNRQRSVARLELK